MPFHATFLGKEDTFGLFSLMIFHCLSILHLLVFPTRWCESYNRLALKKSIATMMSDLGWKGGSWYNDEFNDDIPDLWNSLKGCVKWFGVTRSKCGNPHWTSSNKGMSAFSHHFGKAFEKLDPRFSWPTRILWSYQTVPLVAWQKTLRFKWNFQWVSSLTGRSLYRYSEFVEAGRPLDPGSLKSSVFEGKFLQEYKRYRCI